MTIQRILVPLFSTGFILSVVACAPPAMDFDSNDSNSASNGKKVCEQEVGKGGLASCADCCLAKNPKAKKYADALGKCNEACGKGGSAECFSKCETDYATACKSTNGACNSYNRCTHSCFGI